MSWTGCQNNPIYLNFHLQKSLEIFEKNSADKIWQRHEVESALSLARQGQVYLLELLKKFWETNVFPYFFSTYNYTQYVLLVCQKQTIPTKEYFHPKNINQ